MECSIISFFNLVYQELILHYEYCWRNYAVASQFYGSFHLDFSRNEKNYDSANGCSLWRNTAHMELLHTYDLTSWMKCSEKKK